MRVDGAAPRGLWPPAGGRLCSLALRGAGRKVLRIDRPAAGGFLGLTAFQAEGCGLPLCGNAYKVSVTGFTFSVIWHDRHSANWLAALASPYPASPDFPLFRGQNKTPRNILFISISTISTGYSATACGGKVVAPATKGGLHFRRPQGGCKGFIIKRAPSINVRRPQQPSAAKPLSNLRTLGAIAPSNFRTFKPVRACP